MGRIENSKKWEGTAAKGLVTGSRTQTSAGDASAKWCDVMTGTMPASWGKTFHNRDHECQTEAQFIVPVNDDTGTQLLRDNAQVTIDGGSRSRMIRGW